ncbi:arginine--tRNA ligase [Candidatus Amesbacteria bacterium RIFCSPHIGHO2_01_FULL_48_32]|uniref:Arginine--tRNA ligase n=1 Tax=Candidatus Amesbacteria bacterium RIFCSPLOWO2_01_FULL_48_25 TaxID=1797259 RepID=A0A1F4ZD41_9BACT|nr:MAG: arginine--tRNA ligase [Candidatus Amesbacteria bacterium RIFCSPHIGHO2_01_FULL_48_32]OGD04202.1 MAG: arginine--tRNA ligase [Candidatus Amesbacteria bacterium RIFCSPLOWO2_01_FULL_48_25]
MQKSIRDYLLEKIGKPVKLEHPEREEWGDYAFFAKDGEVEIKSDEVIERVEKVGGFVNIWLQNEWLSNKVSEVIKEGDKYGSTAEGSGKTVVIDYSAPNIAKRFGIGHLRSTIIGQALYNLHQFLGYKVIGDNHLGDWGTQFGKLIYMIKKTGTEDYTIENLEKLYVLFHQEPDDDGARKWFKKLEDGDVEAKSIWKKCVDVSMAEFERIYQILGVKIDETYGESFYEDIMPEVIREAKERGITSVSEGALVVEVPGFKTPLMLLKSDGGTTYAIRDLATLRFRKGKWSPKMIIYEVGAEQTLHFEQVFAVARMLGYAGGDVKLVHTKHGLYLDADGKKFATRKGKTIKLEEVLEEAIGRARKLGCEEEETAKAVGVGAIKYFDLSHNISSDIVFDWEKVMALEGNSGPYLQYTFARTQSVLSKASTQYLTPNPSPNLGEGNQRGEVVFNDEERSVLRYLYRFPEVVQEAAVRLAPNLVCNYLYELASKYNTFYNKHSILSAGSEEARNFRIGLTVAVGQILKNGLGLLEIEAPGRM